MQLILLLYMLLADVFHVLVLVGWTILGNQFVDYIWSSAEFDPARGALKIGMFLTGYFLIVGEWAWSLVPYWIFKMQRHVEAAKSEGVMVYGVGGPKA